jgi:hypothetical protein
MSFESATEAIESSESSALMGLANNARMFRELVQQDNAVTELLNALDEPAVQVKLLNRILGLISK